MQETKSSKAVSDKGYWHWLGWTGSLLLLELAFFNFLFPRLSPAAQDAILPIANVIHGLAAAGVFLSLCLIVILALEKRRLRKELQPPP